MKKENTIDENIKQELGECIPPPMGKFLALPNRKSMGQSGSVMIFFYFKAESNIYLSIIHTLQ